MNRAEAAARGLYERNRKRVIAEGTRMNIIEIIGIAKQQDALYGVINQRRDLAAREGRR